MKKVKPIGDTLKVLRKRAGLTQRQAYEAIGVPQSTFSSWERGVAEPPLITLIKLCQLYGVRDVLKEFGLDGYNEDGSLDLNINEESLVENYRKLDKYNQETVYQLIERMAKSCQRIIKMVQRPLYDLPASAGTGQFLDSDYFEMVDFPEDQVPADSTFAVRISGDSMEPDYTDESIVFVKQAKTLEPGEIGIFVLNNEGYIKELGDECNLISYNPSYPDIEISEFDDLRVIGKVVGKYDED